MTPQSTTFDRRQWTPAEQFQDLGRGKRIATERGREHVLPYVCPCLSDVPGVPHAGGNPLVVRALFPLRGCLRVGTGRSRHDPLSHPAGEEPRSSSLLLRARPVLPSLSRPYAARPPPGLPRGALPPSRLLLRQGRAPAGPPGGGV